MIRNGWRVTGVCCLLAGLGVSGSAEQGRLVVRTLTCDRTKTVWPIPVQVSVFDADKVPEIARLSKEIYDSPSCGSVNTADRCLALYVKLRELVMATPAMARVESLQRPEQEVLLPPVQQVIVFAFDKSGAGLSAYVQARMLISPDEENEMLLDFSSEARCKAEP
jgi:hypothetical protein